MSTPDLVKCCQRKDRAAEKALFLRFAPKVLTICRRYARSDAQAQDYLQECFLQIFKQLGKYDAQRGEFSGWLYRVATNTILQQLRRSKRQPQLLYLEELPEVEDDDLLALPDTSSEQLMRAIQQLPDGYREVLNLYVFEGWTHREIADTLGITPSASRSQLARAKQYLKKKLEPIRYEKQAV